MRAPRTTVPARRSTWSTTTRAGRPATGSAAPRWSWGGPGGWAGCATTSWEAGDRIGCPTLVLWGATGLVGLRYDALGVWREYAITDDLVQGQAVPGGHFLPEEAPTETIAALGAFLS